MGGRSAQPLSVQRRGKSKKRENTDVGKRRSDWGSVECNNVDTVANLSQCDGGVLVGFGDVQIAGNEDVSLVPTGVAAGLAANLHYVARGSGLLGSGVINIHVVFLMATVDRLVANHNFSGVGGSKTLRTSYDDSSEFGAAVLKGCFSATRKEDHESHEWKSRYRSAWERLTMFRLAVVCLLEASQ